MENDGSGDDSTKRGRDMDGVVKRIRAGEAAAGAELAELFSRGVSLLLTRELDANLVEPKIARVLELVADDIRRDASVTGEGLASAVRARVKRELSELRDSRAHFTAPAEASEAAGAAGREALSKLSPEQKDLLRRHYILEQPRQQICAEMQIGEHEFRSLKSGARSLFDSVQCPKPVQRYQTRLAFRQPTG